MDLFEGGRDGENYNRFKKYATRHRFKIHDDSFEEETGGDLTSFDMSCRGYNKDGFIGLRVCLDGNGFFIMAPKGLYFEDKKYEEEARELGVIVGSHDDTVDGHRTLVPIFNGNKTKLPEQYALASHFVLDLLLIERFWNWLTAIHEVLKHTSNLNGGVDAFSRLKVVDKFH